MAHRADFHVARRGQPSFAGVEASRNASTSYAGGSLRVLYSDIVSCCCIVLSKSSLFARECIVVPYVAQKLGVLCVAVQVAADGDRLLIVTGGDDHAICVAEVEISFSDRPSECLENDQDRRGVAGEQRVAAGGNDR